MSVLLVTTYINKLSISYVSNYGILYHDILYVTTIMTSLVTFICCTLMILMYSTMRIYVGNRYRSDEVKLSTLMKY